MKASSLFLFLLITNYAVSQYIIMKDGYMWDSSKGEPFLAYGMSYQTFNGNVFASQSNEQLAYDLQEMKNMYVNSLRVEFTWGNFHIDENEFTWDKADFLVHKAEELGLKLHVLIGYQYPPLWFSAKYPDDMAVHYDSQTGAFGRSTILNYNSPKAKEMFARYLSAVGERYKNSTAIASWILGNEFAFYDLWENTPFRRFVGFDTTYSLPSFKSHLQRTYSDDIQKLNAKWGTNYNTFEEVPMALVYPMDMNNHTSVRNSGYHDVIQWRKNSIANFIAHGATACRSADPNHLLTYSMVGGIFSGYDSDITCEDFKVIVQTCKDAGAPLDFFSVNSYPFPLTGSEMRSIDFGIVKYRNVLDIPVMLTETGVSSNDGIFREAATRYQNIIPSLIWESLLSGVIGVHLFHFSDRDGFNSYPVPLNREAGFGAAVHQDRTVKGEVYYKVKEAFRRLTEAKFGRVLAGSQDPRADVAVLWGTDIDLGYNRANQEFGMIWGAFRRLGLQVRFIADQSFDDGQLHGAKALYLPRNFQMRQSHFQSLLPLIQQGIHIHASGDLPGQFDEYHSNTENYPAIMRDLFGIDVSNAEPGWQAGTRFIGDWPADYFNINNFIRVNAPSLQNFSSPIHFGTWKIWHGIQSISGTSVTETPGTGQQPATIPGIHLQDHAPNEGKSAIMSFAIGDIISYIDDGNPPDHLWKVRRAFLEIVYSTFFGMSSSVSVVGEGAESVALNWRYTKDNEGMLISLLNMASTGSSVTVISSLLANKKVEDVSHGRIITNHAENSVDIQLLPDENLVLYVYSTSDSDNSLINSSPSKLFIQEVPSRVWPNNHPINVTVHYSNVGENMLLKGTFESVGGKSYGVSEGITVSEDGIATLLIPIQQAQDEEYKSTLEGGSYQFKVSLMRGEEIASSTSIPVSLFWGVKPIDFSPSQLSEQEAIVKVKWENLPSTEPDTLLNRKKLWTQEPSNEVYTITLQLQDQQNQPVFERSQTVEEASGQMDFVVQRSQVSAVPQKLILRLKNNDGAQVGYFEQ